MARKRQKCSERKPHFFKILLGDFHQRLRIPPAFLKHISKEASSSKTTAILEGPTGSIWNVKLCKRMNETYLQDGWRKFAKAHFLSETDFLVFRYNGGLHFSVRIFDRTGCEREEGFNAEVCEGPTYREQKKRVQPLKKSLKFGRLISQHKAHKNDWKNHQGQLVPTSKPESLPSGLNNHDSGDVCTDLPSLTRGEIVKVDEDLDLTVQETGFNTSEVRYLPGREKSVRLEKKAKLQERSNSFTSKFPFFATHIGLNQVYKGFVVYIPVWFSKLHLPKENTKITLQNLEGKMWEANLIWNTPSNGCLISAGWSAFSRGNCLNEGDICIFELVDELKMHVHIFRSDKETSEGLVDLTL